MREIISASTLQWRLSWKQQDRYRVIEALVKE